MIVLVVLSILIAISYPIYQSQAAENRRSDGKRILLEIMNEQQKFQSRNGRYTLNLINVDPNIGLGLDDAGGGAVSSENGFYLVTAAVCDIPTPISDCVLLTATAQAGHASDGNLTYNSRNQKTPTGKWGN